MRRSCDAIQKSVPGSRQAQESRFAPVEPERRARKWQARERDGVDGAATQRFTHSNTKIRRERNPMTGIAHGIVIAIDLACMRQPVEGEIERAAPGVIHAYISQLREDIDHFLSENGRTLVDRGRRFRHEAGTAAK